MSAWDNSDRRSRLPSNWNAIAREVKKRDGWRCRWTMKSGKRCPRTTNLQVDHRRNDDDHSMGNLWTLCEHHHGKKTVMEAFRGKQRKKPKPRPPEPHPGLRRA